MASCVKNVLWLLGILLIHRGDQPGMSTIENSTTTFYELMINNNNNHHNQSSLQNSSEDAVAFDVSPAAWHARTRPSGGHARTAEATLAVSRSVPAQRPFGRLPPCAKVETSYSDGGLNVLYHVVITLVQLWFSVRRKKATMVAAPIVGRVRGHRRDLGPALRAAAARIRRARNAAIRRGRNRAHVPQPALLPTPPAPAETSAEDACQHSPSPLPPTPPVPVEMQAPEPTQLSPSPLLPTTLVPVEMEAPETTQLSPSPLLPTTLVPVEMQAPEPTQDHRHRSLRHNPPPPTTTMRSPELVLRCVLPVRAARGAVGVPCVPAVTLETSRRGSGEAHRDDGREL
ncbi:uncharacterized protein LOC133357207 [Lethenteron reissneri]|uniref:uncharacterized protein LOC133357207 n=1 Tax=Lethenteron reissneri TaxID=7753 RepID=UPI002AB6B211|nr:uncharacterized protein LOC133357207 [Lethenteron reissneri]